ncbi:hypothetical protein GQ54DRAFT_335484 [Martensiomyces pterosporus]|nr:hypothetical protein GQ54DRAFT_335484 [Martensiomyces pterosporus]
MADSTPAAAAEGNFGSSPGKFDRLVNRLSRTVTSPKVDMHGRRSISPVRRAESEGLRTDKTPETHSTPAAMPTQRGKARETLQAGTQRKREKIAELRRRRKNMGDDRPVLALDLKGALLGADAAEDKETEAGGSKPGSGRSSRRSSATSPSFGPIPETPVPRAVLQAHNARQTIGKIGSPTGERFFNDVELNLLLQPIELENVDSLLSPPPQQQQQQPVVQHLGEVVALPQQTGELVPSLMPAGEDDEADFTINIPSTSLSPMVPLGWNRGMGDLGVPRGSVRIRRRSRTVALAPGNGHGPEGDLDDGAGNGDMFSVTPSARHPRASRNSVDRADSMTRRGGGVAAKGRGDDDMVVDLLIEAEVAQSLELRKELARLHGTVRALTKLAVANKLASDAEASSSASRYQKQHS